MRSFREKIKRQDVVQWTGGAIVLYSFLYPVLRSITLAPLKSDATLNLYIAQQLAAGEAPYSGYFIMHPPISHFLGALAVFLGDLFSIQAVIATRLMALLLCIFIIYVTYLIAREIVAGKELLAVWAIASNVLMLMVVWGFYEKLVMVLFLYLAVYMVQKGRAFASGLFIGLVLMAWGGGIVLLPVFLIILFLRPEISWQKFLLAIAIVFVIVFVVLAISGTFADFFQQYFVTVFEYAINKFTFSGIRDADAGVSNIANNTNLSRIDLVVLLGGGVSFLVFLFVKKREDWFAKSTIGILAITLVYGLFILIDYQSPFDLIILFPALSILFAWSVSRFIALWVNMWNAVYQPVYMFVFLFVFSFVRVYSFQQGPSRLSAQKEAAARLQMLIEQEEILFLGDLSPLVLLGEKNPSPAIHMGPKSFLAMDNQGYTLFEYIAELAAHPPALILADQRNMEYEYLTPLYSWLEENYVFVGDTHNPNINVYANREADDVMFPALAFLFNHNPGSYDIEEMDLVEMERIISRFIPINDQLSLIGYEISDTVQLYWWTPPPLGANGAIVYRLVSESGEYISSWIYIEQQWYADEISIMSLPFADLPINISGIEFCVTLDDVYIDTCEGAEMFSLIVSREN